MKISRQRLVFPFILGVLAFTAPIYTQVIDNPAKPLAKDGGRVLKLAEIWRIVDESGQFFFKYPYDLEIGEDGSLFLADVEQFLKFSADGEFLGNLYKKGQGPGEIAREFSYHQHGRDLFIQDMNSERLWRTDLEGRFQEQINLAHKGYAGFVGVLTDGFLFLKTVWPPRNERTGKLMEIIHTVALVGRDGTELRDIVTFRPKVFLAPNAAMVWDPNMLKLSPNRKLLYAVHSRDYLVEAIDLSSGTVVKRIRRAYQKIAHSEYDWENDFRNRYGSPKIKFEPDVDSLYPVEDGLWVATSTEDKAKGRMIDVFDLEGHFVDSFYLGPGRKLMAVRGSFIFCQEKNEDETIDIVKYRIVK